MTELEKFYKRTLHREYAKRFKSKLVTKWVDLNGLPTLGSEREDGLPFTREEQIFFDGFLSCYQSLKKSKPLGAAMAHRESIRKSFEDQKKSKKK